MLLFLSSAVCMLETGFLEWPNGKYWAVGDVGPGRRSSGHCEHCLRRNAGVLKHVRAKPWPTALVSAWLLVSRCHLFLLPMLVPFFVTLVP